MDGLQLASPKHIPMSLDAALVAAFAGTAMPFSHSAEEQAEHWLRALRLHGKVGTALQALGVGEAPLEKTADAAEDDAEDTPPFGDEIVEWVVERAEQFTTQRGASTIGTTDLLFALFEAYDRPIDRALQQRGASRDELIDRLAS
jgi:ATP-dependent Clp protease ATP-binding subunit ClpA